MVLPVPTIHLNGMGDDTGTQATLDMSGGYYGSTDVTPIDYSGGSGFDWQPFINAAPSLISQADKLIALNTAPAGTIMTPTSTIIGGYGANPALSAMALGTGPFSSLGFGMSASTLLLAGLAVVALIVIGGKR